MKYEILKMEQDTYFDRGDIKILIDAIEKGG